MRRGSARTTSCHNEGCHDEGCHDDVNKHVWLSVFWRCCDINAGSAERSECNTKAKGETEMGRTALLSDTLRDYSVV